MVGLDEWWRETGVGAQRRELFYLDAANMLTTVPVQTSGGTFAAGNPVRVFDTSFAESGAYSSRSYDMSPDGQRFLMIKENVVRGQNATSARMVVVLDWFEELKAKLPARQ